VDHFRSVHLSSLRSSFACAVVVSLSVASPSFAQGDAVSTPAGFPQLFTGAIKDFKRLPSKETLTWLTIGAAAAAAGHSKDWDVTSGFTTSRRFGDVFKPGEAIGGARAQFAGAVAAYTIGRVTAQPRVANLGADLIRAQVLTQTITAGIKLSVRRGRPDGTEFSFPSGHTSVTFASATVLQRHFGWKAGVPSYAVASYVAASRVRAKRHFLSDVAFGATLGILAGRTVTVGRGQTQFAVSPTVSPHGAGISFDLLDRR
jgi:membrane-associated phospholipid phosphatase